MNIKANDYVRFNVKRSVIVGQVIIVKDNLYYVKWFNSLKDCLFRPVFRKDIRKLTPKEIVNFI